MFCVSSRPPQGSTRPDTLFPSPPILRTEPIRPLVDGLVRRMTAEGVTTVTSDAKQRLVRLIGHDLRLGGAVSPVSMAAQRLAQSLARSFEERKPTLALFDPPDTLDWASLGPPDRKSTRLNSSH